MTKEQFKKISVLAKQANMTVNEWTRHQALGTKVTPTLIQVGTSIDEFLSQKSTR
ncbi:hypothetical protein [Latilactobacillus graminis]|uniref:Uncharacterized protein n=1 Tax=Latilactobacillus graminis DSM 20719 TaxID=1423752 RepID=A0AA89L3Q6_9LACO|nr:hypothetical protein FC90_GL001138 [Latilactobacillus graminis DSM 20719]